ncbi:hypothetical protein IJI69_01185 [Candidatus Saccharibacteria bacterium]|nr:hypothetical protein [Candidatus Saccharibacteria bacterium]
MASNNPCEGLTGGELEVCNSVQGLPNSGGVTSGNLANVLYWIYAAAGIIAVAVLVYAGIKYLSSQGEPAKTKQASQIIAYAIIGLVIVLLAGAVTAFVSNMIGGSAK